MAIQLPDPGNGVPEDETGDNEHVMWLKTRANFSDQNNAASRLVGTGTGQIPLAEQVLKTLATTIPVAISTPTDLNTLEAGSYLWFSTSSGMTNYPPSSAYRTQVLTFEGFSGHRNQIAYTYEGGDVYEVWGRQENRSQVWGRWKALTENRATYSKTTAAGANVVMDSDGTFMRSTSSERYKDILADLVLTDEAYNNAMSLAPIIYRSTADADNSDWHFYSFSAEALGAFDKAFVLWRQTETVTDADGNTTEQPLAEPQAEGLNINALLAFNHAITIKQDAMIKALTQRVNDLAQKLEA